MSHYDRYYEELAEDSYKRSKQRDKEEKQRLRDLGYSDAEIDFLDKVKRELRNNY